MPQQRPGAACWVLLTAGRAGAPPWGLGRDAGGRHYQEPALAAGGGLESVGAPSCPLGAWMGLSVPVWLDRAGVPVSLWQALGGVSQVAFRDGRWLAHTAQPIVHSTAPRGPL